MRAASRSEFGGGAGGAVRPFCIGYDAICTLTTPQQISYHETEALQRYSNFVLTLRFLGCSGRPYVRCIGPGSSRREMRKGAAMRVLHAA